MALSSKQLFTKSSTSHFNPLNPNHLFLPIISCHIKNNNKQLYFKISTKARQSLSNVLSPDNYKFLRQSIKAHKFESTGESVSGLFDSNNFLNVAESVCLVSSVIATAFLAVKYVILGAKKWVFTKFDYRVLFLGAVMHVGGTVIGVWARRRQCGRGRYSVRAEKVEQPVDLVKKVEEMEGGLRDVVKVNRVLAKQLEKLGVRFRVTRRSLKDPIDEAAALAQKNSEAHRALALQMSILEEEIGESQKAMLAMQEQQHKQLELILAMGKALKLLDDGQRPGPAQDANKTWDSAGVDLGNRSC